MISNLTVTTFTNGKGGVGNTASAVAYAQWLSMQKRNTLIADYDPQADSTKSFGQETSQAAYDFIDSGEVSILSNVRSNLDLLAGNGATAALESTIRNRMQVNPNALQKTADKLRGLGGEWYESIVIDTAKSGIVRQCAVMAADVIVIPTTLDYSSASNTLSMVQAVTAWKRQNAVVVLPMFLDGRRKRVQGEAIQALIDGVGDSASVYAQGIPVAAAIEGAGWDGRTIYECNACATLIEAYNAFFEWLHEGGI